MRIYWLICWVNLYFKNRIIIKIKTKIGMRKLNCLLKILKFRVYRVLWRSWRKRSLWARMLLMLVWMMLVWMMLIMLERMNYDRIRAGSNFIYRQPFYLSQRCQPTNLINWMSKRLHPSDRIKNNTILNNTQLLSHILTPANKDTP